MSVKNANNYLASGADHFKVFANQLTAQLEVYGKLLSAMIRGWRQAWNDEIPFLVVQLPNFGVATAEPNARSDWAIIRDHQASAVREGAREPLSRARAHARQEGDHGQGHVVAGVEQAIHDVLRRTNGAHTALPPEAEVGEREDAEPEKPAPRTLFEGRTWHE